jgi:hypothetical protein
MFSRKIISISIYLMIVILIFIIKPEIMFNSEGEMKNFGYYINEETTIVPVILVLPILALLLFVFTLIIECIYT